MNKIDCDICMDLIPLVKDGVTSENSQKTVEEHLKICSMCSESFSQLSEKPNFDDKKTLKKIKKQLNLVLFLIIVFSVLFGVGLTMSENMFYNIIIMPAIGAIGFLILKNRVYIIAMLIFGITYIWHLIMFYLNNEYEFFLESLIGSIPWAFIYTGLCSLGILIGFLLYFAFKKEEH